MQHTKRLSRFVLLGSKLKLKSVKLTDANWGMFATTIGLISSIKFIVFVSITDILGSSFISYVSDKKRTQDVSRGLIVLKFPYTI